MCLNGALCSIPFNLIRSEKVKFGPFDLSPGSGGGGSTGKVFATMLLHASIPLI